MGNDAKKEEDVLAKMKDLQARLDECEEELHILRKSRGNDQPDLYEYLCNV